MPANTLNLTSGAPQYIGITSIYRYIVIVKKTELNVFLPIYDTCTCITLLNNT